MKWLRLCVFVLLPALSVELGKSDRKARQEKKAKEEEAAPEKEERAIPLTHPPASVTKQSILKDHEKVDYKPRKFDNPLLVYVTPWNGKGYDLAKWVSHKVTHVAPVWLQVKPHVADLSFSCRILGTHDIDHEWVEDVRKNNSEVKIVPRVLFDNWEMEILMAFLQNEAWMNRCIGDLINLLTRSQFDGVVVELWANAMVQSQGEVTEMLVEMLNAWGSALHKKDLQLIVPVGPPLGSNYQLTGMFTPGHLYAMAEKVDYIQVRCVAFNLLFYSNY
ncbi:hypothetical protein Y032_0032g2457 [Ancylostoma ceylanicum]|uniref:Chitinase domain-containing protein 1 n=1 Tax=Ancylostoma ceylanicum TaxID=53326 RepID=A0A016UMV9_9BILA|nr:hypothetical protein Y032_0032g2457 [Ancylostoma ceylanicum]